MTMRDTLDIDLSPPCAPGKMSALMAIWRGLSPEMQDAFLSRIGAARIEDQPDMLGGDAVEVEAAISAYNHAAGRVGWPRVQRLSDSRKRALRGRLRDCGGMDGWRHALAKAEASDFLCGRSKRAWTAFGFDWMVKPANFTKIMEGNYDNSRGGTDRRAGPDTLPGILDVAGRSRPAPEPDWLRG